MASSTSRRWARRIGLVAAAIAVLAILRPWTVRPLETAPAAAFDPEAYATKAWPRLVEEASRTAVDVAAARQTAARPVETGAPARKSVFVRTTGAVTAIDRRSRVGVARLRTGDGPEGEVGVQVGPVIRGTALRDATSFIQFNDFANQFEFAAVSNALHERVLRDVVGPVDLDALVGRQVTVIGATTMQTGGAAGAALDIIPIQLVAEGGPR